MSHESFDVSTGAEEAAGDIYNLTVCNGAVPVIDFSCEHLEELKSYDLIEATGSEPCDWVYMTRKGMDWMDNVVNCQHHRCGGNYEDVYCRDCGADYNNGRLL
tara:strand:+ start:75 stop:383 length:309 start_codon:yes stop_codon:yes gene_type:complete